MKAKPILLLLVLTRFMASAQITPPLQSGHFRAEIRREVQAEYLLYLPDGYNDLNEASWPMLVFLHGSGERGADLAKVTTHGPPKLVNEGKKLPFVLLSPQCPDSTDFDTETIFALIQKIANDYRVDKNRIYLTGLSMGGWGTWDLAMAHPHYFAAIAPVCGRVNRNYPMRAAEIKELPVWVFHGAADDVVPILESARMVKALKDCGNDARFTIYPLAGHDSWTDTYNNPDLYEWFLSNRKK